MLIALPGRVCVPEYYGQRVPAEEELPCMVFIAGQMEPGGEVHFFFLHCVTIDSTVRHSLDSRAPKIPILQQKGTVDILQYQNLSSRSSGSCTDGRPPLSNDLWPLQYLLDFGGALQHHHVEHVLEDI